MTNEQLWMQLEALRQLTELTGGLHDMQKRQLMLWPRCVYFQSTKSTFTWTPGEGHATLTQGRVDRTLAKLKRSGLLRKAPDKPAKSQKRWKKPPEIRFDVVLDSKAEEPPGLSDRVQTLIHSLRRMLAEEVKITVAFSDGRIETYG